MLTPTTPPRLLVIGDAFCDRYLIGRAERISPEAPVPVVSEPREELRPGGAAAVAWIAAGLGAEVTLATIVPHNFGDIRDPLEPLLDGINVEGTHFGQLIVKTRVCAESNGHGLQQIVRIDEGEQRVIPEWVDESLRGDVRRLIEECRPAAIAIADYGKGVCSNELLDEVMRLAAEYKIPVLVDPARDRSDLRRHYNGASLIKMNRSETLAACSMWQSSAPATLADFRNIKPGWHCFPYLMTTLDGDGAVLHWRKYDEQDCIVESGEVASPSLATSVVDVTGAGDAILAALGVLVARNGGLDGIAPERLLRVAMRAAAAEVGQFGVSQVPASVLDDAPVIEPVVGHIDYSPDSLADVLERASVAREIGEPVTLVNGCFDVLTAGHLHLLEMAFQAAARSMIVVAINSDESVRRLKGESRPINSAAARAAMLKALWMVDAVVIFDDDTPLNVIEAIRPDVLVRGDECDDPVGADLVRGWGGRVVLVEKLAGHSTSATVERMKR